MPSHSSERRKTLLPEIPEKLYFRIGEVAKLCAVPAYVLRFWESEFPQLKPGKSGTGQRLYRRREVELARRIRSLLYDEGYTIAGARQAFSAEARKPASPALPTPVPLPGSQPELPLSGMASPAPQMARLRAELKEILGMLSAPAKSPRTQRGAADDTDTRETDPPKKSSELFD